MFLQGVHLDMISEKRTESGVVFQLVVKVGLKMVISFKKFSSNLQKKAQPYE